MSNLVKERCCDTRSHQTNMSSNMAFSGHKSDAVVVIPPPPGIIYCFWNKFYETASVLNHKVNHNTKRLMIHAEVVLIPLQALSLSSSLCSMLLSVVKSPVVSPVAANELLWANKTRQFFLFCQGQGHWELFRLLFMKVFFLGHSCATVKYLFGSHLRLRLSKT